jgi:hypothetical protein
MLDAKKTKAKNNKNLLEFKMLFFSNFASLH